jgi:hypothetical protein
MRTTIIKKVMLVAVALMGVALATSCEKDDVVTNSEDVLTTINPVNVSIDVSEKIDNFFRTWNDTITDEQDSCIFVINTIEELLKIGCNDVDIDFEKYSLIWGKFIAYKTGGYIEEHALRYDKGKDSYIYEIIFNPGTAGYTMIYNFYFWELFPKKEYKKLLLNIKKYDY